MHHFGCKVSHLSKPDLPEAQAGRAEADAFFLKPLRPLHVVGLSTLATRPSVVIISHAISTQCTAPDLRPGSLTRSAD